MLSGTPRAGQQAHAPRAGQGRAAGTHTQGWAGTSIQPISVLRDVKYCALSADRCIFLKTPSNCTSVPLLPTHTNSLSLHSAALTALCCNSGFLLLILNVTEINNRLFLSSLKSLRSSPQSLLFM